MTPAIPGYDANPGPVTNFAKGAVKGAASTANSLGHLAVPDWAVNAAGGDANAINKRADAQLAPHGTAQAIGKGTEQVGEFLVPGLGEEAATAKLGKFAPLGRMAYQGLTSGAVNKLQGGDFSTGAATGLVGGALGEGLRSVAPKIAESALNIRKLDRAYKGSGAIGRAILDETTGFTPAAVSDSAEGVLGKLNPELEHIVGNGGTSPVNMAGPRAVIDSARNTAIARNAAGSYKQLEPMARHLTEEFATGAPIPSVLRPMDALNLKRGFGEEFIHHWNPETMAGTKGTAAKVYHELANEIHTSVPGSAAIDTRISNLIPVAKRAASEELNAPTTQKLFHKFAAPTGALIGGITGGEEGYKHGGVTGAVGGAAAGLVAPMLLASPTGQMVLARGFNSAGGRNLLFSPLKGGALQLNRPGNKADNQ
jgi:hypothetical protein